MTDATTSERAFFSDRGFGLRIGFGRRPALLAVDLIKAFTDPALPLGSDMQEQIHATNRLAEGVRQAGGPVIFSTVSYDDAQLRDAGVWRMKQGGLGTLLAASGGPELDERLRYEAGDSILTKKYASCFFGTDLASRLVFSQVDTLILTGCTTSGCVRASVVDALQNGFRPIVVREAVGDRSKIAHDQSLFDMDAKYADVVGLGEAMDYLAALA
ncbi:isochorismatase family protein [Antarcticirhabdus aurantiaca]|uniref:isochorismatase family protein n=1 Tax=Antarcticirhabdus aurantiaca TaxID=2606717 RepID=UPI00131BFAA0|nr:isochorismatase family protein [Antarcticirhabdus aurantiaca]